MLKHEREMQIQDHLDKEQRQLLQQQQQQQQLPQHIQQQLSQLLPQHQVTDAHLQAQTHAQLNIAAHHTTLGEITSSNSAPVYTIPMIRSNDSNNMNLLTTLTANTATATTAITNTNTSTTGTSSSGKSMDTGVPNQEPPKRKTRWAS